MLNPNCSSIITELQVEDISELRGVLTRLIEMLDLKLYVSFHIKGGAALDYVRMAISPDDLRYTLTDDGDRVIFDSVSYGLSRLPANADPLDNEVYISDSIPTDFDCFGLSVEWDPVNRRVSFYFNDSFSPNPGFISRMLIEKFDADISDECDGTVDKFEHFVYSTLDELEDDDPETYEWFTNGHQKIEG